MKSNVVTTKIKGTEYTFRIVPLLKSDKKWCFQIEDLPPASRFILVLNDDDQWVQNSGNDKIKNEIVSSVDDLIRKQYL